MGLSASHGGYNGAYSKFNRLRVAVCRAIGGSWPPHEDKKSCPDNSLWYYGNKFLCPVGVKIFLNCSDTYTSWNPAESMIVASGLREIVERLPSERESIYAIIDGYRKLALMMSILNFIEMELIQFEDARRMELPQS